MLKGGEIKGSDMAMAFIAFGSLDVGTVIITQYGKCTLDKLSGGSEKM